MNLLPGVRANTMATSRVRMEMFEGSGHFPVADAADRWRGLFFEFLASVG